jgi:hypothetical protein
MQILSNLVRLLAAAESSHAHAHVHVHVHVHTRPNRVESPPHNSFGLLVSNEKTLAPEAPFIKTRQLPNRVVCIESNNIAAWR